MAHRPHPFRPLSALLAALAAASALPGAAQTLGDIDVRSAPGAPLDATIALGPAGGAAVGNECIFLSRGAPDEGTFVTRANVAVYEDAGARFVRLKSVEPVRDKDARLRVVVQCPGQPHVAYREYRALFAPAAPLAPVSPPASAGAPTTASTPLAQAPAAGSFPVRQGDSMESLARLMFPRQREAQRAFIAGLRERNPSLSALGDRDPIPADAAVELPDLRALPRVREAQPPVAQAPAPRDPAPLPSAAAEAPTKPQRALAPPKAPAETKAPAKSLPAPKAEPSPTVSRKAPPPVPTRAAPETERFSLRLSGSSVDLSRSRGIDDATRAKLRERLLVLDNDDQVAALLQLRDSMKRLEGRVAELQLKLSGLPANLPPARPEPPQAEPKAALPIPAPLPKAEAPAKSEPPKVELAPPPEPAKAEPAKVEPAKSEAPKEEPPKAEPPKPTIVAAPEPKPAAAKKPAADWGFALSDALWIVVALLVLAALYFAWRLARRNRRVPELEEEVLPEIPSVSPKTEMLVEPRQPAPPEPAPHEVDFDVAAPVAVAVAPAERRAMASDAGLATDVPAGDPAALRRRYIEQRFPEIATGAISLSDPDSIVKAARLLYEDGALPRAVELLQFATEENPHEQKPWLALFEIFRLERLKGQFADLATRFRDKHGHEANWRKVQFFGREIDPGNALYRDLSVGIETIKFESGKPPSPVTYDPVAENWLNAPMDFENELLMVDLRRSLLESAQVAEDDLAPNPMPALRSVEMFTVA